MNRDPIFTPDAFRPASVLLLAVGLVAAVLLIVGAAWLGVAQ